MLCCFDDRPDKTDHLAAEAAKFFEVNIERGLTLLTIRHYDEKTITELTKGRQIVLEQKTPQTVQLLIK